MKNSNLEFSIFRGRFLGGYSQDYIETWRTINYSSNSQASDTFEMQLNSQSPYYRLYALVGLKIIDYPDFENVCKKISESTESVWVKLMSGKKVNMTIAQAVDLIISSNLQSP